MQVLVLWRPAEHAKTHRRMHLVGQLKQDLGSITMRNMTQKVRAIFCAPAKSTEPMKHAGMSVSRGKEPRPGVREGVLGLGVIYRVVRVKRLSGFVVLGFQSSRGAGVLPTYGWLLGKGHRNFNKKYFGGVGNIGI